MNESTHRDADVLRWPTTLCTDSHWIFHVSLGGGVGVTQRRFRAQATDTPPMGMALCAFPWGLWKGPSVLMSSWRVTRVCAFPIDVFPPCMLHPVHMIQLPVTNRQTRCITPHSRHFEDFSKSTKKRTLDHRNRTFRQPPVALPRAAVRLLPRQTSSAPQGMHACQTSNNNNSNNAINNT